MADEKIKLGFIGAGWVFRICLAPSFRKNKAFELVSVSCRHLDTCRKAAAQFDIARCYDNWREMLDAESLDAVVISTPPYLHQEMTVECARRGLHVLCEKPCALNADQTRTMIDAARKAGVWLLFGMCYRYMDASMALRDTVRSGRMGRLYFGKAGWMNALGPSRILSPESWKFDRAQAGGGILISAGVHTIDRALWAMDYPRPTSVYAKTSSELTQALTRQDDAPEDLCTGFINLANGVTLYIENTQAWNGPEVFYYNELYGTEGGIRIYRDKKTTLYERCGDTLREQELVENTEFDGELIYDRQAEDFAKAVKQGAADNPQHEQMICLMEIIDALYDSARTGSLVEMEPGRS